MKEESLYNYRIKVIRILKLTTIALTIILLII